MQLTGFQVTLNGRDIFTCPTRKGDLKYGNPFLEWMQASHWARMTFEKFRELSVEKQTLIIAAYRTEKQIEAAVSWKNRPRRRRR